MPASPPLQPTTFKQRVASQFAQRPTLREVVAKAGLTILANRYPWITRNHPQLQSLEPFTLIHSAGKQPAQVSLVNTLLDHFLTGKGMALTRTDVLSIAPPLPFLPQAAGVGPNAQPEVSLNMANLNRDFDELLAALTEAFQQAQIGFWAASDATSGLSHVHRLAQTLKAALLLGVERQGLSEPVKAVLYGVVNGTASALAINRLQVTLDEHPPQALPDLLIIAEAGMVLWCKPSGTVRSYVDLAAFAEALRDALAQQYQFDTLRWAQQPLNTDPFAFQSTELLNGILDRVGRLRLSTLTSVPALEEAFSTLSDPSSHFLDLPLPSTEQPLLSLPTWLNQADSTGHLLYAEALLELAASQAHAQGRTSLDAIEPLGRYAARRLREQMHADFPAETPQDPDQLLVQISVVVPLSSSGPAQLNYLKSMTLTELAIARLHTGSDEVASGLLDTHARPLGSWLNLDYVNRLISTVDVGGRYPAYVAHQLQDATLKASRLQRHATEWRSTLQFAALRARIETKLSAQACQAIVDFCRANHASPDALSISPLAFLPAPGASEGNTVHGMFLIKVKANQRWVLYRPLFADDAVAEFASLDSLMAQIRADQALQQQLLAWMDDDARGIYQHGGFERPHLHSRLSVLAHLIGTQSALVDTLVERLRVPVTAVHTPWLDDLDNHLYNARIRTMLLLASRQSRSNAQQRWALIVQGGWVLFNTVTPLLRGPAAMLAWLVAAVATLKDDLPALSDGSAEEKALAAADVLTNLALLLMQGPTAPTHAGVSSAAVDAMALEGPARRAPSTPVTVEAPKTADWVEPHQAQRPGHVSVSRWHNSQRVGNLPSHARQRLGELRAGVSLQGHAAETQGRLRGLYKVQERLYVNLQDVAYEVQETWGGIQIIGPDTSQGEWHTRWGGAPDGYYIVGRERSKGPWLRRWNDEWVLDLHLAGGMPRTREAVTAQNRQHYDALQTTGQANQDKLTQLEPFMERNRIELEAFDDEAAAFSLAFKALPNPDVKALPPALRVQRQAVLEMRRQHLPQIAAGSLYLEKQASLLHANADLYRQMLEPRYLKYDLSGATARRLSNWTEAAIDNDMLLVRRLLELVDHEHLQEQSVGLRGVPDSDEQRGRHAVFRESTRDALKVSRRLLVVSERLDKTLSDVLSDARIAYPDKKAKIERAIKLRPYSSLIVRAQIVSDLAYLTLDKTLLTAEAAIDLLPLQNSLSDTDLSAALWSHDGVASANLPADQQAEVLGNALRVYRAVIGRARYMQSFTAPAVDTTMLQAYIEAMTGLERLAETDLSTALMNAEQGSSSPARQLTHRVRAGKRTLIRTSRGRAVLVERDQEGDHAVQRNPATEQPGGAYERRNGQWFEVPGEERPAAQDTAQLRSRAQHLLAHVNDRVALAARYANEPNSLADLMDWQIEDMRKVEQHVSAADDRASEGLASQLRDAIASLNTEKRRLLTDAYLNTRHPDSSALRYLYQQQRIEIALSTSRKPLRTANDYLDVYQIKDVQVPNAVLWEAHFHYRSADAAPRTFVKGHLKHWEPRPARASRAEKAREVRLEHAHTAAERIDIYRGDLRLDQIEGIIPFPAH
ncbi:hypothetical protein HU764_023840 [Pseudomonas sp. SWRI100]|uniref:dermonecrotic toxin domain-containing protein n=1 Tax=Pseudomonas TaxID=286 RepID=UPI0016453B91|nr:MULTISPECIES: DUF6543 domain-containing protein [Pseudomonas]MBC3494713.1 hypothetical protein [Pseudomonas sp. SWRI67]MBV4529095.1 hypothetical protein [Pseudomonas kermanshahensis]